jgi:predicted small secreted protein
MTDIGEKENQDSSPETRPIPDPDPKKPNNAKKGASKGATAKENAPVKRKTTRPLPPPPRSGLSNVDLWQIIGVLFGVITVTVTATMFINNKLEGNAIRKVTKEDFWQFADSNGLNLESALHHYLGDKRGDIVYRGLVKRFENSDIIPSQKQSMKYYITISETPPAGVELAETLRKGDYLFIESELDFRKFEANPRKEVIIAAITEPNELARWVRKKDVIFREVIGVNKTDQDWLKARLEEMNKARSAEERIKISNQIFRVDFSINDMAVPPIDLRKEAFGLSLVYKVPSINWNEPVQFKFRYTFVQPKEETAFPIVITEPTQNLDVRVDYSRASLRNLNYFRAFFVGDEENPHVSLDRNNSILQIRSTKEDEWIFPGGGVMVYWSQQ